MRPAQPAATRAINHQSLAISHLLSQFLPLLGLEILLEATLTFDGKTHLVVGEFNFLNVGLEQFEVQIDDQLAPGPGAAVVDQRTSISRRPDAVGSESQIILSFLNIPI